MAKQAIKQETIPVKGMTCQSCVKNIKRGVGKLDGVRDVKVDLLEHTATVSYDGRRIALKDIEGEIATLGYSTANSQKGGSSGVWQGVAYGLVPHLGCIAFIIGSIVGSTLLIQLAKPLLMNRYFFHILVAISFAFATAGILLYLRSNGLLSWRGAKRKAGYISTMYGTTIGVNLLLFLIIFPALANVSVASTASEAQNAGNGLAGGVASTANLASFTMTVDIPCPGHAPLISSEVKSVTGVRGIAYSFPKTFTVTYDPAVTSKEAVLALDVFQEYPATMVSETRGRENTDASDGVAELGVQRTARSAPDVQNTAPSGCGCGGYGLG